MTMFKPGIAALAAAVLLSTAASAEIEETKEIKVVVKSTATGDDTAIHWTSHGSDFDIHDMQVGESRSFVDDAGRAVLLTKETDGFSFNVDGKTVRVPEIGAPGEYMTLVDGSDATANFDVEIAGDALPVAKTNTVTIISDEPLDATTQESIKAVLLSAGRDDDVSFVDRSAAVAGKRVHLIRKTVEIE